MIDAELIDAASEALEAAADLLKFVPAAIEVAEAPKDFSLGGGGIQLVPYDLAGAAPNSASSDGRGHGLVRDASIAAAGIAVVAQDTGRCLLLQRSNKDPGDPARGTWEFPGGKCDPGESAFVCAQREWEEEMGQKLPSGAIAGQWTARIYRCYVWLIAREDIVSLLERTSVTNPDDPDHDDIESVAWWNVADIQSMPALRMELRDQADWTLLRSFAQARPALKELDQLANWLLHKKPIEKFEPRRLPEAEFRAIVVAVARRNPIGLVLAASRNRLLAKAGPPASATRRSRQRELALRSVMARVSGQLGRLAKDPKSLPVGGAKVLRDAYAQAYRLGNRAALMAHKGDLIAHNQYLVKQDDEAGDWEDLPPEVQDELDPKIDKQQGFLVGLAAGIAAGVSIAVLAARLDSYAEGLIAIFEGGY